MKKLTICILFLLSLGKVSAQIRTFENVKSFKSDDTTKLFSVFTKISVNELEKFIVIEKSGTLNDTKSIIAKDVKNTAFLNGEQYDCYSNDQLNPDERIFIGTREIFLVQNVKGQSIWYELNKTSLVYTTTNLRW